MERDTCETDSDEAYNIGVSEVSHKVCFPLEVLLGLEVGTWFEGLDGDGGRSRWNDSHQFPLVHLAERPLAQLLNEADGGDGELAGTNLNRQWQKLFDAIIKLYSVQT